MTSNHQKAFQRYGCRVLLTGIVAVVYAPTLGFPFTNWDDGQFITNNSVLTSLSLENLKAIWSIGGIPGEMLYIPLTYTTYLLEAAFASRSPVIVHLDNILLHVGNTLLVYGLVRQHGASRLGALTGTLVFAVHPLQVEAVSWAMGRKDVLATFLALLCLSCYYRFSRDKTFGWYAGSLILAAAAALAKPAMFVLPLLVILFELHRHDSFRRVSWRAVAPLAGIAAVVLWLDSMVQKETYPDALPLALRFACIPWVVFQWFKKLLLVAPLSPFYPWPHGDALSTVLTEGALFFFIAGALAWIILRRRRDLRFGTYFAVVAALPAIGIVVVQREFITADRYSYFPMTGLALAIGALAASRPAGIRHTAITLTFICVLFCLPATLRQVAVWRHSRAVWGNVVRHFPDSGLAHNNLGMAYLDRGDKETAAAAFRQGLMTSPGIAALHNNLGRILLDRGNLDAAHQELTAAVRLDAGDARAPKNLGDLYAAQGDEAAALAAYRQSIRLKPDFFDGLHALGNAQLAAGQLREAGETYLRALELQPRNPFIQFNLGLVHDRYGSRKSAIAAYRHAVDARPEYVEAWFNLANLAAEGRNVREAESAYRQVLRLQPQHWSARINLGNLYLGTGRLSEAEAAYRTALDGGSPHYAGILYNLGLVYRHWQRWEPAIETLHQALTSDPSLVHIHNDLARCYYELGNLANAIRHCDSALAGGIDVDADLLEELARHRTNGSE